MPIVHQRVCASGDPVKIGMARTRVLGAIKTGTPRLADSAKSAKVEMSATDGETTDMSISTIEVVTKT